MADGNGRAWRERLVSLVSLAFGGIKDVGRFLETGDVDGGQGIGQPAPVTPQVSRYMRAIEQNGGRVCMPDEVDRILGDGPTTTTERK